MQPREFRALTDDFGIDRCVILASTFRSGSTYTAQVLAHGGFPGLGIERFNKVGGQKEEDLTPFLKEMFSPFANQVFATKLMWSHRNDLARKLGISRIDSAQLAELFPNATWIYVKREDVFAQAVSMWRAKESNRWHVLKDENEPILEYDFKKIEASFRELSAHNSLWEDFFSLAGIEPHTIVYEQLIENLSETMHPLFSDLGLDTRSIEDAASKVELRKQRDEKSAEYLARFMDDLYKLGR